MKNIHLAINNQQSGPFDPETIKQMLSTGQADANTMGWMEGMDGWKALNSDEFAFLGIQSAPPVANASTPSSLRQKSSDGSPLKILFKQIQVVTPELLPLVPRSRRLFNFSRPT